MSAVSRKVDYEMEISRSFFSKNDSWQDKNTLETQKKHCGLIQDINLSVR
jgi:hypothetical protein